MGPSKHATLYQSFEDRACLPDLHPLASYLFRLMTIKRSNLCLSADVTSSSELLNLAEEVGRSIVILKTHADIVNDFTDRTYVRLQEIARRKHFIIFEDRKFGDIGSTVQKQYMAGPYKIVRWAHITNAHMFPGPAIVTALKQAAEADLSAFNSRVATEISATSPQSSAASSVDGEDDSEAAQRLATIGLDARHQSSDEKDAAPSSKAIPIGKPPSPSAVQSPMPVHPYPSGPSGSTSLSPPNIYPLKTTTTTGTPTSTPQASRPSIVAIKTTISTHSELVSPLPSSALDAPLRKLGEDAAAALERLGPAPYQRGLLLLAEMSSQGHLMTPTYTERCIDIARDHKDFVMGFIAQRSLNGMKSDNFLTMTPGVQLAAKGDGMGQQYNTPARVVGEQGADVIIVGRGILNASDRAVEAERYRREGWKAYEMRIKGGQQRGNN